MDYPEYALFTARFGEEPYAYLQRLTSSQLQCIARALEIKFVPPFDEDEADEVVREAIINAAVGDYQEPGDDKELIRAVEKCGL